MEKSSKSSEKKEETSYVYTSEESAGLDSMLATAKQKKFKDEAADFDKYT